MSQHGTSPEFERKLQQIGARSAHMVIPRSEVHQPITEPRYPAWTEEPPMTDSEELFALICGRTITKAVERILAAGYRKPQQVTTYDELYAIRPGTTVVDKSGALMQLQAPDDRGPYGYWAIVGLQGDFPYSSVLLPATVLHVGGAE